VAGVSRWHGDEEARRAVYNNRARLRSGVAREAFALRTELVERGFALVLDRGGMRRAWLRGRENLRKRYLVHVAGYIESTFATVRLRTDGTKGCLSRRTAPAMVFKLAKSAERRWRRLDGTERLAQVIAGVRFRDGEPIQATEEQAAA
jgi:hypothetical protein